MALTFCLGRAQQCTRLRLSSVDHHHSLAPSYKSCPLSSQFAFWVRTSCLTPHSCIPLHLLHVSNAAMWGYQSYRVSFYQRVSVDTAGRRHPVYSSSTAHTKVTQVEVQDFVKMWKCIYLHCGVSPNICFSLSLSNPHYPESMGLFLSCSCLKCSDLLIWKRRQTDEVICHRRLPAPLILSGDYMTFTLPLYVLPSPASTARALFIIMYIHMHGAAGCLQLKSIRTRKFGV